MKREIATKRSNIDSTKRLTFIKNGPPSLQSSSSSSISNAEASLAANSSRTVRPGNSTKPCPSHIPSINPSKVADKERIHCSLTGKKATNQSKIAVKLQPGTRLKGDVENKSKLLKKQQEEGHCDECGDATQEPNQGKFTSPWVLSGDGANMKSKSFKKSSQNGMHSKLPTMKLYSTKLNRSRSNLSGCKSPHLRSILSRRSISRSHSKLSGSRKNLVPPAPPVRTVSLKNSPRPPAQSGKQKSAPEVAAKSSNSSANIQKPGNELSDKNCSRMQASSDKKSLSSLEAPKIRQKFENHRNERKRYSEEIEVNLNYVNLFNNHSSTADNKDVPNDFRISDHQSNFQSSKFEAPKRKVNDLDELSDRKSIDVSWDSLGRRIGSKFNYVVKKTGITERRDSKVETNEYVTMETIRKLKNNLNVQKSPHNSTSLQSNNNNNTNQQKFQGISRLNSEPGHKIPLTPNPSGHFMRSRLGSVPSLPSNLPMNFSVVSDSTLPNNHPFKQNGNLCKRSMSDVGGSPVQRSSSSNLNVARDNGRLQSYSSQSLRLSQNSAFSPLFNPVEQDLARLRNFSASQNKTLNRLHLLPFQEHHFAPSRHKSYRLSHSSLSSDRSIRSCSSSFLVPLGRSTKEVQELQKELEHAQSRINSLTSQLTSNVQVVASFEQNLEKMLKRFQNMNTKDSETSELKNLLQTINHHHHHHHHHSENTCGRISKSCEDLLDSKRNESPHAKKDRKKNWLMNSLSKAFLRNRNKTSMDAEVFHIQHFGHETFKEQPFAGREMHLDAYEEFSKAKPPDHIDSLQLNIRTKTGKAEITVKQYTKKKQVYSLFVVIKKDQGLADEKNLYKILAGNIEITNKMSWQDLDSKVQICFEDHLKKLDENSLDLSRESIFNYNVGGLWRNIGEENLNKFLKLENK